MGVANTTKATTPARLLEGLTIIAAFLNAMGPGATPTRWSAFQRKVSQLTPEQQARVRRWIKEDVAASKLTQVEAITALRGTPSNIWRVPFDKAKKIQREIDCDLAFLKAEQSLERPFDDLVDRLNGLRIPMAWQYEPLAHNARPQDPSQAILEIPWNNGTTGRWTTQVWPGTKTLTKYLYLLLGRALEHGLLTKLRVCRHCGKYLVAVRGKRRGVCPGCKDAYQNQKKTDKGYWKKNRQDHRDMLVTQACVLKASLALDRSEASIEILQKKTRLPRRVVEKILAGDLSPNSQRPPKTGKPSKRRTAGLNPTFVPIPLTKGQLATIIAEEAHRDEVYMQGIRAARKSSKQKPARKSK